MLGIAQRTTCAGDLGSCASASATCAGAIGPRSVEGEARAVKLLRLCVRVLGQLGPEKPLGWLLALANVLLAVAAFAEPVLFGRIVDALYAARGGGGALAIGRLVPLMAA